MRNSRLQSRPLPEPVAEPRNHKQKLRNNFTFLSDKDLKWRADEISSSGESFMKVIVDTFWLIDGQHDVFKSRDYPIPSSFHSFTGYNQPQLSKHRKRERENMSCTSLRLCADTLFGCLQGVYWERSGWKEFTSDIVLLLATSLSKYADYLVKQSDAVKRVHSSLHPVRQISENLSFGYLPLSQAVSPCFHPLEQKLAERSLFEYLLIEDVCPAEPRKKYEYIQILKEVGLSVKAAFLTYSHGNNIGSLHFVWKVLESG